MLAMAEPLDTAQDDRSPRSQEIVLLCNPRAGGRWKELARIFDSDEAKHVRRIVTDSVADVGPALESIRRSAKLLCIYGGDGTIQRVLDNMVVDDVDTYPQLALIGGGTMNVTATWCGLTRSPYDNFREVVQGYLGGQLLLKDVPLLEVRQGARSWVGFTFGIGSAVRILYEYERGKKGKAAALRIAAKSIAASWSNLPRSFRHVVADMRAEIELDGEVLPFDSYTAAFCNVTGKLNPGVEPFVARRSRDTFYVAAYAISAREFGALVPLLMRGWRPADAGSLRRPVSRWDDIRASLKQSGALPRDPRYVNRTASRARFTTDEAVFTVDGEIIMSTGEPIELSLGPTLQLAVSATVALPPPIRLAADAARKA